MPETARIEAFSDGVFAIAITLLIIEVRVPELADDARSAVGLFEALVRQWPSYLGFLISFVVIGIMWANHHNIFKYIRRSNHVFVMLNVLLLMCVAFVPFPTAVLAEYLQEPGARVTAAALYSGTYTVTAIVYNALWRYAAMNGRLLGAHTDPVLVRAITRQFLIGPVLYAASTALAFVSVPASLAVHGLLAILYLLPNPARR
ncbi:MAG: TMEM175 family protein [Chloroflexota bacterium]|nr:TMEM175 family protein [Chloroflexota bacterium]